MNLWTLIRRSLRFHALSHVGTLLGAAVGSAVLVGALVVGDSVRGSLLAMSAARLGRVGLALGSNDRFFRWALAEALAHKGAVEGNVAPAIQLLGMASTTDESARANHVQVLGINDRFFRLAPEPPEFSAPRPGEVILNGPLAVQLAARVNDTVLLRVPKPGRLSREVVLSPQSDAAVALRLRVTAIADENTFGRFSLQASQVAPLTAFVNAADLQKQLELGERANLLLASSDDDSGLSAVLANFAIREHWQLEDAELEARELPARSAIELRSRRVFLDPAVAELAISANTNAQPILTYFVNELGAGDRTTPYSMVTAAGPPLVPADLPDDGIVINQWLADDLNARVGDSLQITYYAIGLSRQLEERAARFRVQAVIPLAGPAADPGLMPDFPGLEHAESTSDWDPSLPISLSKVRDQDEQYWRDHRGTPKAFIGLAAGRRLWENRFGTLTAIRFPVPPGKSLAEERARIAQYILARLIPAQVGLSFQPVRAQAVAAATQSQDFGGLFIGFSFFLIIAALLLMALLFQFGLEQRAAEIGTLLALGFRPRRVRGLLLLEGGALALLGGLIGTAGGIAYARLMIQGLSTIWRDAVGTSALRFYPEPATLVTGALAAAVVAWATLWLTLRKQARQPARELLEEGSLERPGLAGRKSRRPAWFWTAAAAALLSLGLVLAALVQGTDSAPTFFGAGALLLVAGLLFATWAIAALSQPPGRPRSATAALGLGNITRRPRRSLTTLGLLACGSFLVASIGVFRLDSVRDAAKRSSGTGGFALIGESTLPILQDLNQPSARENYALDPEMLKGVSFVPFRVREGEDASCLNLNRAQRPRVLGVNPALLAGREAFTFARLADHGGSSNAWMLLRSASGPKAGPGEASGAVVIPAIADYNSIRWALGKEVGDTIPYLDEHGRRIDLKIVGGLANSILQGSLIIDEAEFVRLFPSETGYQLLLVDAPAAKTASTSAALTRALRDTGLELTPAAARLAAFNAVQNTYLGTFQVLGGLGLLLGSIGLGVVVLRNVLERRAELALLLAVGFRTGTVKWLLICEHGVLVAAGLGIGVISAAVVVVPSLRSATDLPYQSLGLTLLATFLGGWLWTWLAAMVALRGELLTALRNE